MGALIAATGSSTSAEPGKGLTGGCGRTALAPRGCSRRGGCPGTGPRSVGNGDD